MVRQMAINALQQLRQRAAANVPAAAQAIVQHVIAPAANAHLIPRAAQRLANIVEERADRETAFNQLLGLATIIAAAGIEEFIRQGPKELLFGCQVYLSSFSDKGVVNAALAHAIDQKDIAGVKRALSQGADTNYKFAEAMTSLHLAARANDRQIVALLLTNGALVNARMFSNLTPLHVAALYASSEVIKELLKYKAQINARSSMGITPLHLAAYAGNIRAIKALIQHDDNVNAPDNNGETPLDWARREKHYNDALLIVKNGGVTGSSLAAHG